jgi:hypothetical protein
MGSAMRILCVVFMAAVDADADLLRHPGARRPEAARDVGSMGEG